MDKLVTLILLYLCTFATPIPYMKRREIQTTLESKGDPADYRLPTTTIPLSYTISFVVDPNADSYSGTTRIKIKVLNNTDTIVMHFDGTIITSYDLTNSNNEIVPIKNITTSSDDKHFLFVNINSELIKDQIYDLEFNHSSNYGVLTGLYKSSYTYPNGTRRNIVITQLGLTYAREAFPCYDEPALKATFDLTVYAPNDYFVISNMDVIEASKPPVSGFEVTSFRTTPLMSTYLLAFVVSDFIYKSNTENNTILYPKEFRIYAKPAANNSMQHALETGQRSIQYLQAYIDVPYRLPKSDHVAVADFYFGAMENWGIVLYREDRMLYIKGKSTTEEMSRTSILMSHEIAHFWFGDEVSPLWWDYTWLSEGFATFFEQYATNQIYRDWRITDQFVVNSLQTVMRQDALSTSNPMTTTVASPDEILNNFNGIAYQKAASVIRMMQHILGESKFRLALSNYIKRIPTGAGEPRILFEEMQKTVESTNILPKNVTIHDVFGSWSNQAGFPIVYVSRIANNQSWYLIRQERFYVDSESQSSEKWWVPITWATSSEPSFENTSTQDWLDPNSSLQFKINDEAKWVILNKQHTGYYRIMYDNETWYDNIQALKVFPGVHVLNKAQLIDDAFTFASIGRLEYKIFLSLLQYLKFENDWIPWIPANRALSFLEIKMPASQYFNLFRLFMMGIIQPSYVSLGLEIGSNDTYTQRRFRNLIGPMACKYQLQDCLNEAEVQLESFIERNVAVDPDVKYAIYCGGVRSGILWDGLFRKYLNETDDDERLLIIRSLGCAEQTNISDSFLNMTVAENSLIRNEDVESAVLAVLNECFYGVERVLIFFNNSFVDLRNRLIESHLGTTRIINRLGSVIVKDDDITMFQNFIQNYNTTFLPNERDAIQNALRAINENQLWISENMDEINQWLIENVISSARMISGKNLLIAICLIFLTSGYTLL